jgi:hypothetical protein
LFRKQFFTDIIQKKRRNDNQYQRKKFIRKKRIAAKLIIEAIQKKKQRRLLVKRIHGSIAELHVPEASLAGKIIAGYCLVQQAINKKSLTEERRNNQYNQNAGYE